MIQKNKLVNQVLVETKAGNRSVNLMQGDILQDDGQLTVLNVYEEAGVITGDFSAQLQDVEERVMRYNHDGGHISYSDGAKRRITIYVKKKEQDEMLIEDYEYYIQSVFSVIMLLELEGCEFQTIALPVLFRKTILPIHEQAIQVLLKQAEHWLEQSLHTRAIRYYVYLPEDMELWNTSLDNVLGRPSLDISEVGEVQQIRQLLVKELDQFSQFDAIYWDTLMPLRDVLQKPQLTLEVVAAFARKLAEGLCEQLFGIEENSFDLQIRYLSLQKKVDHTFIQQLYLVKAFGNSAVHRTNRLQLMQTKVEDLQILLLLILQLIQKFPKAYKL